tara:strand:- start:5584 stop:6336 length:753 start_codon:yes stop_codon:yes gene_type:complete
MGTVLYALILAIGRDPLPGADERFTPPALEQPAKPQRLDPIAGIETSNIPALDDQLRDRVAVPIQVLNVPTLAGDNAGAGVATFHTLTGGEFRWLPLSEAMRGADNSLLVTADAQLGTRLTVTLASKREHARHGYISKKVLDVTTENGSATPIVSLQGQVHDVQFNLPTNVELAGPMRLQRVDDRQWLPMRYDTSGLNLRRGTVTSLKLGAGTYELQDPLLPDRSQQFTVPETTTVEVSASLAPARDDRP